MTCPYRYIISLLSIIKLWNVKIKKRYYHSVGGETQGPVTIEELKLVEGLNPDTLVRYEGSCGWKRVGNLVELADFKDKRTSKVLFDSWISHYSCDYFIVQDCNCL
jgi:hypothetical protein